MNLPDATSTIPSPPLRNETRLPFSCDRNAADTTIVPFTSIPPLLLPLPVPVPLPLPLLVAVPLPLKLVLVLALAADRLAMVEPASSTRSPADCTVKVPLASATIIWVVRELTKVVSAMLPIMIPPLMALAGLLKLLPPTAKDDNVPAVMAPEAPEAWEMAPTLASRDTSPVVWMAADPPGLLSWKPFTDEMSMLPPGLCALNEVTSASSSSTLAPVTLRLLAMMVPLANTANSPPMICTLPVPALMPLTPPARPMTALADVTPCGRVKPR